MSDFFNPTEGSTPGFPFHPQVLELAQTHVQLNWSIEKEEDHRWVVKIGCVLKS